jgi:tetratricopeptide (TPR) repeat protein
MNDDRNPQAMVAATDWRARLLAIDGNDAALARLDGIVRSGRGFAFVGAGASAGLYPLWSGLLGIACAEARAQGLASESEVRGWTAEFARAPQSALEAVRTRLGESLYRAVLRTAFRPKAGLDGQRFSPLHGIVTELGFRGIITTNYDPGLLEARRALTAAAGMTGYLTWQDDDGLREWFDESAFNGLAAPILFAHGIYERPDTVVLTTSEYQRAYQEGPYRQLLQKLLVEGQFVFVGVGFSDPWFEDVVTAARQPQAPESSVPRHIALVPLREAYAATLRQRYVRTFDVDPIFYPVGAPATSDRPEEDHAATVLVLKSVKSLKPLTARLPAAEPFAPAVPERGELLLLGADVFAGRTGALQWLDDVAADPSVRIASILGLGGLGKTALVHHWIHNRRGHLRRRCAAVLAWSFDERRNTSQLLDALVDLGARELDWPRPHGLTALEAAIQLVQARAILVIVDGVDRLQSAADSRALGALLDEELRQLLVAAARPNSKAWVVATSRLPLVDLEAWLGASVRELELTDLPDREGALLLELAGVKASDDQLAAMNRQLRGNPLALRIFADGVSRSGGADPGDLLRTIVADGDGGERAQWRSLLSFYERSLSSSQAALLGGLALVESAPREVIRSLTRGLSVTRPAVESQSDANLDADIEALVARQLVHREAGERDAMLLSCHPIVRGHFRSSLLGRDHDVAVEAITALRMRPRDFHPMGPEERRIGLALLDGLIVSGHMSAAWTFFDGRFRENFAQQAEPALQLRTLSSFVASDERRAALRTLSPELLKFFLSAVVVVALGAGRLHVARLYAGYLTETGLREDATGDVGIAFLNNAIVAVHSGDFTTARREAAAAADALDGANDIQNLCFARAVEGYALALSGRLTESRAVYLEALRRWQEFQPFDPRYGALGFSRTGRMLDGYGGMLLAEVLYRRGELDQARELVTDNLEVCAENEWMLPGARCEWLLGRIDCAAGRLDEAEGSVQRAIKAFRAANSGLDLGWALLSLSEIHRRRGGWDTALATVADAFAAMGGREKPLQYTDGLVQRARILLDRTCHESKARGAPDRFDISRAIDLGLSALALACERDYVWAELEAARLLAEAYAADGAQSSAEEFGRRADSLQERLLM